MIILIIGTPDSGKSKKAEDLITELSEGDDKVYVATMIPFGKEGEERIARHRRMREGKNFTTIECPVAVDKLTDSIDEIEKKSILLECMSNLVGNEMHADGAEDNTLEQLTEKIVTEVMHLGEKCRNLVVVSNSFPEDEPEYDDDTRRYVKLLNEVNILLKEKSDQVYELIKGEWIVSDNY